MIFHRCRRVIVLIKQGHSWFRSVLVARRRSKGPYAVAVVVIATLKCAGGKKGKGSSRVKKKHADPRNKRHVLVCVVVNGDDSLLIF